MLRSHRVWSKKACYVSFVTFIWWLVVLSQKFVDGWFISLLSLIDFDVSSISKKISAFAFVNRLRDRRLSEIIEIVNESPVNKRRCCLKRHLRGIILRMFTLQLWNQRSILSGFASLWTLIRSCLATHVRPQLPTHLFFDSQFVHQRRSNLCFSRLGSNDLLGRTWPIIVVC